jgi:hypothetical protein
VQFPISAPTSTCACALHLCCLQFVGCVLPVPGLGSLFDTYVAALLFLIPLLAWEAIGHAASLYVIHAATKASPAAAPYVGLTGLLTLTAPCPLLACAVPAEPGASCDVYWLHSGVRYCA